MTRPKTRKKSGELSEETQCKERTKIIRTTLTNPQHWKEFICCLIPLFLRKCLEKVQKIEPFEHYLICPTLKTNYQISSGTRDY